MNKVTPKQLREYHIFSNSDTYRLLSRAADTIEELERYKNLEKQGRILILPCKIGDAVWETQYYPYRRIVEEKFSLEMMDELGKNIFLTKDEAEKEQKIVLSNRTPSCWC